MRKVINILQSTSMAFDVVSKSNEIDIATYNKRFNKMTILHSFGAY